MKMLETKNGKSYWNDNGKYQKEYQKICTLIPAEGECKNKNLEIFRCLNNLAYDLYNNGACNWNESSWLLEYRLFLRKNGFTVYKSANCIESKIDKIIEIIKNDKDIIIPAN